MTSINGVPTYVLTLIVAFSLFVIVKVVKFFASLESERWYKKNFDAWQKDLESYKKSEK